MRKDTAYYAHLLELLRIEREEDYREYLETVRQMSLAEQSEQGVSWYPVQAVHTGFYLGERAFVVVERTSRLDAQHRFKAGQPVSFFTRNEHVKHPEKRGIVNYVDKNRMKIVLETREPPDWIQHGPLGVTLLFDDRSYAEMERAVHQLINAKGSRLAALRDLLAPPDGAQSRFDHYQYGITAIRDPFLQALPSPLLYPSVEKVLAPLNPSQRAAVAAVLDTQDITLVHGPPGSGKTTTIVAAITLLVEREHTVLVCAPSNTAADLLTERLSDAGLIVVRVGNTSRIDDHVLPHTLEAHLSRHPESKHLKKVKIQAAEYRRKARQHKRHFNAEDRRERDNLKAQARELEAWARELEDRLIEQILTAAQAITCTLVGAANPVLEKFKFKTCVIDEAAQALEPAAWIPIAKCQRIVLAGDPYQLPPTVKSAEAARKGLSVTLMERCLHQFAEHTHLLDVQYRMHEVIMDFSNQYFYGGALKPHEMVRNRRLFAVDAAGETLTAFEPLIFIDTAGAGFEEEKVAADPQRPGGPNRYSRYNPNEALLVREHLLKLIAQFPTPEQHPSIGVLSPYREQVSFLEKTLIEDPTLGPIFDRKNRKLPHLETPRRPTGLIQTIDGFQGQECDVIYISLVRSNPRGEIGFLSDYRRMNVAMTRARKLLIVIGDSASIGANPFYRAFIEYCEVFGHYESAYEHFM